MRRVFIASPYAGDIERNVRYARACLADSLARGEAPYAPHLLYTQPGVLRDELPEERERGLRAGHEWLYKCECLAAYIDCGVSAGMQRELDIAKDHDIRISLRQLRGEWESK